MGALTCEDVAACREWRVWPGLPSPRPAGDALVLDLPVATGRSLTEYAPTALGRTDEAVSS
ncbi:hypothetical protein ACQBAT_01805 [Ornithinimicrobium sp. Y1847]|uniref:hypothetical protein n=1 Tax=Ornithinimicrobium sp. Y1847 TaxID=3405419 RepID=UPI003B66D23B